MSIFEQVTNNVIKNERTLHGCKDLNSAQRFSTLCVVERRRAFWFWKQPVMIPTFVTLKDLLIDAEDRFSAKEKEFTLVKNVKENAKKNMSGKIKVDAKIARKIAANANLSLGGADAMDIEVSLGDIAKSEIPYEALREELKDMQIDTSHPVLVETSLKSPKSSLCVVLSNLSTQQDGKVKEDEDVKVSTSLGANVIKINVTADGSVESKCIRSFDIPSGTVLAYECHELDVDENGVVDIHGVAETFEQINSVVRLPENPFARMKEELEPLMKWKNVARVQEEIKSLIEVRNENDFRLLHILLYHASVEKSTTSIKVSKLLYLLGIKEADSITKTNKQEEIQQNQHWTKLVITLGFTFETINEEPFIVYPKKSTVCDLLRSVLLLIDSILDCFRWNLDRASQLNQQNLRLLMKIIKNYFSGVSNSLHQEKFKVLKNDPEIMEFLRRCGFRESPGGELTYTANHLHHLLDVYVVLCVLTAASVSHCSII